MEIPDYRKKQLDEQARAIRLGDPKAAKEAARRGIRVVHQAGVK